MFESIDPFLVAVILAVPFVIIVSVLSQKKNPDENSGVTGVVDAENMRNVLLLGNPSSDCYIEFIVFRQSGNFQREEHYETAEDAIIALEKLFRKLREPKVRIWTNLGNHCDVRRPYGSLQGTREGKKIWGAEVRIVGKN